MNFLDLIIITAVALFLYMGYLRGFIRDFADLLALIGAIILASFLYTSVGNWLSTIISLPDGLANTIGFFLIWFVVMVVYYGIMTFFYDRIPDRIRNSGYNKWFGLAPALIRGIFFIWFTVNLLSLVAVSGQIEKAINDSFFSRYLTRNDTLVSNFVSNTFSPGVVDTIRFLTIKPQSGESISLDFTTTEVTVDDISAKTMLELLNKERKARGLGMLVLDDKLTKVGEEHCRDMFARGYFSHNTPDGKTPFERMDTANINYLIAGENLALAPNVSEAFAGLMDSPGHKANMLSSDFGRVGIGVVDGGVYGKMFAQEFTN